jgi:hypothetical protein
METVIPALRLRDTWSSPLGISAEGMETLGENGMKMVQGS